jgi:hypothetical protein
MYLTQKTGTQLAFRDVYKLDVRKKNKYLQKSRLRIKVEIMINQASYRQKQKEKRIST